MRSIGESFALFLIKISKRNLKEMLAVLLVAVFCLSMFSALTLNVNAQQASGDYWITRAPVPVALGVEGATTGNGQIYVFGQDAHGNPLTYEYNPLTNAWTEKTPIPISRTNFGLVAFENLIYAMGGITGYSANGTDLSTGANEEYNPSTDTWITKASMPTNRSEVEAVTANSKIYVMGGRTAGAYSTVNITEIYNPKTDSWTTGTSMPYPVVAAASATIDNQIFIIGGQDEFNHPNSNIANPSINLAVNQIYNLTTNSWSIGQPIPGGAWQAVGIATNGINAPKRVYVIGGLDSNSESPTSANQIFDPNTNSWTTGTSFPTTDDYVTNTLAAVTLNDSIYVIGG